MFGWIGALFDRIFATIGAITCAQIPLVMHQYMQQLTGREAELRLQVDSLTQAAALSKKTLDQLIQKFTTSQDPDFFHQGELMRGMVDRWNQLSDALLSLQNASLWERPFIFFQHLDFSILKSTLQHYTVGLPLTLEGAIYGVVGIIFGYTFYAFICFLLSKIVPWKPAKKKGPTSTNPTSVG